MGAPAHAVTSNSSSSTSRSSTSATRGNTVAATLQRSSYNSTGMEQLLQQVSHAGVSFLRNLSICCNTLSARSLRWVTALSYLYVRAYYCCVTPRDVSALLEQRRHSHP
jgi:hypothetical protein